MKFVITIFVIVAVSLLWFANEILPKEVSYSKLLDHINSTVVNKIKKTHKLFSVGYGGYLSEDVHIIILSFNLYHLVDLKEAREIMVDLVQEYLKEINSNKKIRPYLRNYPFTLDNLEFAIFIFQSNGTPPQLGNIHLITTEKGTLKYALSKLPSDLVSDFPLLKQETLEEALQVLEEESEAPTSKPISSFFQKALEQICGMPTVELSAPIAFPVTPPPPFVKTTSHVGPPYFQSREILLIAHSNGGMVSYDSVNSETLRRLAPKQIHFRGIAPASRPTDAMCKSSFSYAHWLDPVPRMRCAISSCKYIGEAMQDEYGPMPKFNPFEAGEIKYLLGHPDAPLLFDHSFDSPTFKKKLKETIKIFTSK